MNIICGEGLYNWFGENDRWVICIRFINDIPFDLEINRIFSNV